MKLSNLITVFFAIMLFVSLSCGKDEVEKQSSQKLNEKKENLQQNKTAEQKEVTDKTSSIKLFKVDKTEKSAGKKIAPNFYWTEDGKQISLKDLKGNVVLVNFWATWCGPCIKEMPDLSSIFAELKDKNFKMIGMNVFQQPNSKKVDDFLKTNPVTYMVLDGNQELVDAFSEADGSKIEAVPTTFIINKEGKISETIVGARDKATFLKSINKYLN
ncbi:MAG: Thiol-disulfide oxidoreductase ResA [Ignavibacteria bacterium]|nr:Thiol-disulfide oxidoreductase ResA [Ignavibacteria bacterium]